MIVIKHEINPFLFKLFPDAVPGDLNSLKSALEEYYAFGPFKSSVEVTEKQASIELDVENLLNQKAEFDKAVRLCEKAQYDQAKPILQKLIQQNPSVSECHRILGQVLSDEGDQEAAIDSLIDALRWDPKNNAALVMMGNIFTRYKNDPETAVLYFETAIKHNPADYTAVNNMAHSFFVAGNYARAKEYFLKANQVNPEYPNALLGLAYTLESEGDYFTGFDYAIETLKKTNSSDKKMFEQTHKVVMALAAKCAAEPMGGYIFESFRESLEQLCGLPIKVESSNDLATPAKMEFAEVYNRSYHLIRYRPGAAYLDHLKCHELVHLLFSTEARQLHINQLFLSGGPYRVEYLRQVSKERQFMLKEGYSEETAEKFLSSLFNGITSQLYNAPIDLFIEDYLYNTYPKLRPYQMLSWLHLINEGIKGSTAKLSVRLSPPNILHASKVLNMVHAMHLKDLYGIDILPQFNATPKQLNQAKAFWTEYNEYRFDRKPAEEYELVQHWGEDLGIANYFRLADEEDHLNKPKTIEALLNTIEDDPFGLHDEPNTKAKEQAAFDRNQEANGLNMAVVMYMQSAMAYLKTIPLEKVKALAYEFAMNATQGISTNKGSEYSIAGIPNKTFSGYQYLAWYYVSWALAMPDMKDKLGLPYENEWQMANQIQ